VPAWFATLLIQFYIVFPLIMGAIHCNGSRVSPAGLTHGSLFFSVADHLRNHAQVRCDGRVPSDESHLVRPGMFAFYGLQQSMMEELSVTASRSLILVAPSDLSYSTYLVHWPLLTA
jgi:peptidoglycan/LPS O-acetylase OafA/YrhL